MKKAFWKLTYVNKNEKTFKHYCQSCYSSVTNKHLIEYVNMLKDDEHVLCEKCVGVGFESQKLTGEKYE